MNKSIEIGNCFPSFQVFVVSKFQDYTRFLEIPTLPLNFWTNKINERVSEHGVMAKWGDFASISFGEVTQNVK